MVAAGKAFTVIVVAAEVALHPPTPVTVAVKDPEAFTVMDCVVAPVFHKYEFPADAVSTTEPPLQKELTPFVVMVAAGTGFTEIFIGVEVALHPAPFVTCTEYVPAVVTVMFCVVEPFDHKYVFPAGAESVELCPAQSALAPIVETTADGGESTVT